MTDDPPTNAPNNLRQWLSQAGLTNTTAATQFGVSPGTIQNYCDGHTNPEHTKRIEIAAKLASHRSPIDVIHEIWPSYHFDPETTVTSWPNFTDVDDLWNPLIVACEHHFDMWMGSGQRWFENQTGIGAKFAAKASMGQNVKIRVMTADPAGEGAATRDKIESEPEDSTIKPGVLPIRVQSGLDLAYRELVRPDMPSLDAEIRMFPADEWPEYAMFRFDDTVIWFPYMYGERGIHTRSLRDTLHDNPAEFHQHMRVFERRWDTGRRYTNGD